MGPQKSHLPMKIFFLLVAVSLLISSLTGLYMSYKWPNCIDGDGVCWWRDWWCRWCCFPSEC